MPLRFARLALPILLLCPTTVLAESDEMAPVPVPAVAGRPYSGDIAPAQIRFINVRTRPVRLMWIAFDGSERLYGTLQPGEEAIQPTFVAHRWLVRDAITGMPIEAFIATRSALRDPTAQVALIR